MKKIRQLYRFIKEKVWYYPILYSLLAALIAFLSVSFDLDGASGGQDVIPGFFLTDMETGEMILSIVANSFITITTLTFSITMIVLTMYTSQYSPRVVRNFLTQKNTLQSFGVFVSGFLYVMLVFLFMNGYASDGRILSATIGIVYILIGIVFFFRFVNGVASFIQVSNLIERLKDTAQKEVESYKRRISGRNVISKDYRDRDKEGRAIRAGKDGFVRELDYDYLKKVADDNALEIYFNKVTGQFVTETTVVGWYYESDGSVRDEQKEKIADKIRKGMRIGIQRSEIQDFDFTIQKIVELAVRALSPGINDPNTAIHCIRNTSVLLRELSDLPKGYIVFSESKHSKNGVYGTVCVEAMDFGLLLMNTYQQLINYGRSNVTVIKEIIKALRVIAESASVENQRQIFEFGNYLWRKIDREDYDSVEIDMLRKEMSEAVENIKA